MGHVQTAGDALHLLLGWAVGAIEIVVALAAFFFALKALSVGVRVADGGGRARAVAARYRIEAEMARHAERPRSDPSAPSDAAARALRRRLAAIEEVLRSSSFEGEREAAIAARARIVAQLGTGEYPSSPRSAGEER